MKHNWYFLKVACLVVGISNLTSCSSQGQVSTPPVTLTGISTTTVTALPTSTSSLGFLPTQSNLAPLPAAHPEPRTADPQKGLDHDISIADQEMAAACRSTSLPEAKSHAEAVVNTIGGPWGLWYGDGDNDGLVTDPSDQQGVLPAGIIQSSANIDSAHQQLGWAIILYEQGDNQARSQVEQLLGEVSLWRNDPFTAWANVASAVEGTTLQRPIVAKLPGSAVREMAWARLVQVKAATLQEAQAYACQALR